MATTRKQLPPYKEFAVGIGVRSGTILRRNFNDHLKRRPKTKSRGEIVTASDMEVHRFVRYKVRKRFPEHNFMCEEGGNIDNGSRYTWVVDPLDGTLNYTIGNPFFCTSVALLEDGVPIIAVMVAPMLRETFIAEKNRSARLNERNIKVSQERALSRSVLTFSYFHRDKKSRARSTRLWHQLEDKARAMRHLGCTSLELAYVASGRMEASVISPPMRLWDVSAGMLLVEVAGGKLTDLKGNVIEGAPDMKKGLIASNGAIHSRVLSLMNQNR